MANFYWTTNYLGQADFANKLNNALVGVGYTSSVVDSDEVHLTTPHGDKAVISFDTNGDLTATLKTFSGSSVSGDDKTCVAILNNGITEIHMLGYELPKKAVYVCFKRSDGVWIYFAFSEMDNIGGNNPSYVISLSNFFQDGHTYADHFPVSEEYFSSNEQRCLYAQSSAQGWWNTALSFDIGDSNPTTHWKGCWSASDDSTDRVGRVLPSMTYYKFHFNLNVPRDWDKLGASDGQYAFPSPLLRFPFYMGLSDGYICPIGTLPYIRALRRDGVVPLDRTTVGSIEYLLLPWARASTPIDNTVSSKNYFYAFELDIDQTVPTVI